MDQLKQYWEIVKKQHFWILCGLAVLIPLIVSMVANGHLAKVYGEQKTTISRVNQELEPLVGAADHPNPEWVKHIKEETDGLRSNVKDAWQALYDHQKLVLKWPPELQEDFIAAFSKPPEADDLQARAMETLCERYMNFVKTELSHMADIVQAEWAPGAQPGGRGGPVGQHIRQRDLPAADGEAPAKTYIVYWDPSDEARWVENYNWQSTPSPMDVRYAQEEIWVLEAICKSISRANVGATGDFDAVVREINSIYVGYEATDKNPLGEGANRIERYKSGRSTAPGGAPPMAMGPTGQGGPGGLGGATFEPKQPQRDRSTGGGDEPVRSHSHTFRGGATRGGSAPPPDQAAGPADPDSWLKDGRYVDSKGKPLLGSEWANSTTPEYNLMPFKLTVAADEQRWQELLVDLCNSPLPFEVREVRINPSDREGGGRAAAKGRPRPGREQNGGNDSILHNVTLEIHGVVYLMKPPDLAKLGITGAAAGAAPPAPGAVAPAEPANAAAAPAPTPGTAPASPPTTNPTTPSTTTASPATTPPPTTTPTQTTTPPAGSPATVPPTVAPPTGTLPATVPPGTTRPTAAPPGTAPGTAPAAK